MTPAHPEIVVDLTGQLEKPVACVAMVRRALQTAGFPEEAVAFTNEALAGSNEELIATARRYVTVRSD